MFDDSFKKLLLVDKAIERGVLSEGEVFSLSPRAIQIRLHMAAGNPFLIRGRRGLPDQTSGHALNDRRNRGCNRQTETSSPNILSSRHTHTHTHTHTRTHTHTHTHTAEGFLLKNVRRLFPRSTHYSRVWLTRKRVRKRAHTN